jgi:tetratricopeptide (TPR) repeat protein
MKCQFENPDDSNFCLECGEKLEKKCPQCEKALPIDAKFCNGCGHKLTAKATSSQKEFSFDEKLDKIQRYLPKGLTEKILAQRDRIEGERKQVTVMFCDMEGFTPLVEQLGSRANFARLGIARAKVMSNEKDIDLESLYGYVEQNNLKEFDGQMQRYIAEILLNIDNQHLAEAEGWAEKAIDSDKQNDMKFRLGQDYVMCAEVFKRKGDQSKAKENLSQAIETFEKCGADGWVEKYSKEMASLS